MSLENAPSNRPSDTPCFILPESAVSVLYTDILYEKDFPVKGRNVNEHFLTVLTASAAPYHQSAAVIGQLTQPPTVVTCLSKLTRCFFRLKSAVLLDLY